MSGFAHGQRVAKGDRWVCADCGQTVGWLRRSFNYKRLKKENYFQTPEGRAVIEMIERRYPDDSRVRDWLLKLAKNGALMVSPTWQTDINLLMEGEAGGDPHLVQNANERLDGQRPDIVFFRTDKEGDHGQPEPVQPGVVIALGKMLDQGYKGKGIDLMNMTFDEVEALYDDWEQTHRRDPDAGQVVHAFPDGWTMRRLEDRDQAFAEGAEMRNCVPQYAPSIDEGKAHVFSLRDDQNRPHANVLIVPRDPQGHWEAGTVRDIRGKANSTPMDKYADYLRHWFDTFNEKPSWSPNPGPAGDPGPGAPERYGLGTSLNYAASTTEDWIFESSWQVESNWNRVRNQLRHNNQFDEETEITWNYLKGLYGHRIDPETGEVVEDSKHDKLADWIMREVRNGNIQAPYRLQANQRELRDFQNSNENYRRRLRELESDIARLQTGEGLPTDPDLARERLEEYASQAQNYRDYIARNDRLYESTRQSLLDPERIQRDLAQAEDDGTSTKHYWPTILIPNTENYQSEPLKAAVDHDWLGALQTVVKGRQDKAKALRKNPTAYEDKIAEIREKMRGLSPDDETYLKLNAKLEDYQKRISDAENSDLNTLQAPSVAEEVQREAWIRRLAQDGGKVLHTFPDGKTIRWINSADVARLEGDIMGHCIGDQYHERCANGSSVNLSVRDKRGMPHATFEVVPKRQPIISWQNFFNAVEENPEKFEHLGIKAPSSEASRDDFAFANEIGMPIFNGEGDPVLDDNGLHLREGDFVRTTPTDTDGQTIEGWITHRDDDEFGIHRNDGVDYGGGPHASWSIPEIIRGSDHGIPITKINEPEIDKSEPESLIDKIKRRTNRWTFGEPEYREWKGQELADSDPDLAKALISTDSYMPAIEGSHAHQVQGKGNKVPEQRYHKYLRDYFGSFSDEDRPLSVWSSYFTSKPVQYVDHLPDLDQNIDELGAKVEGERGIDWDAIIHSANEGRPEMKGDLHNKAFIPIDSSELEYDPEKGQLLYDAAHQHGDMRDLFKSINDLENKRPFREVDSEELEGMRYDQIHDTFSPELANEEYAERYRAAANPDNEGDTYDYADWARENDYEVEYVDLPGLYHRGNHHVWASCPDCGEDRWLRDDQDGELRHDGCPAGSRYITSDELRQATNPMPVRQSQPAPKSGPNYTPYEASLVQHLGPQIENYFRTYAPASDYQWALHGAPQQMSLKCPSCGSVEIRPCNQCQPADHYICNNCGTMMNMPGSQGHQSKISEGIEGCPYNHGRRKRLHIGSNGDLCACLYHPNAHIDGGITKQADKLNDFLRSPQNRPDLQTPEGQYFLNYLEQLGYADEQTDVMLPWLVREWKKGRLTGPAPWNGGPEGHEDVGNWLKNFDPAWVEANKSNFATQSRANMASYLQESDPKRYRAILGLPKDKDGNPSMNSADRLGIAPTSEDESWDILRPDTFRHWGDWYSSNHPTRRQMQDIMGTRVHDVRDLIRQWDDDMSDRYGKSAYEKGRVVHRFPDDWTVQQLHNKAQLAEEGDIMSHCIGGYWSDVRDKGKLVYSLRDDKNKPHATWAIDPTGAYCPNCHERHTLRSDEAADKGRWPRRGVPKHRQYQLRPEYLNCKDCQQPMHLVPHRGSIEQLQGYDNDMPSSEATEHIRDYMKAFNGEGTTDDERPRWSTRMEVPSGYDFANTHPSEGGYHEYHPGDYSLEPPSQYSDRGELFSEIQESLPTITEDYSNYDYVAKNVVDNVLGTFGDAHWLMPYIQKYEMDEKSDLDSAWHDIEMAYEALNNTSTEINDEHLKEAEKTTLTTLNTNYGTGFGRPWAKEHPEAFAAMRDALAQTLANKDKDRAKWRFEREINYLNLPTYEEAQESGSYKRLSENGYYSMLLKRGKSWVWSRSAPKQMIDALIKRIQSTPAKQASAPGQTHAHFRTGKPCNCKFTSHLENPYFKVADKMNDFLMDPTARPDLQTPEAQEFLGILQDKYHSPKTDALMPWLTREWKKNRIAPYGSEPERGNLVYKMSPSGRPTVLSPEDVNHWADWYHSSHPTRQGVDIMQMQTPDMHNKILEWEEAMKAAAGGAATHRGEVDHQWPDGWTVQRLEGQKPLEEEGELLAHCIGGYHQNVRDGDHIVYSLRDQDNTPQASWAIVANRSKDYCPNCKDLIPAPDQHQPDADGWIKVPAPRKNCPTCGAEGIKVPHGGTMEQIQAKGNSAPTPEMQRRIKDWVKAKFTDGSNGTEDTRPKWDDQDVSSFEDLGSDGYTEYHPGDYGLNKPETYVYPDVWRNGLDEVVESLVHGGWSPALDPEELVANARDLDQLGELADAIPEAEDKLRDTAQWEFDAEYSSDPGGMAETYGKDRFEDSDAVICKVCDGDGRNPEGEECSECGGAGRLDNDSYAAEMYYEEIGHDLFDEFLADRYHNAESYLSELNYRMRDPRSSAAKPIPCQTCGDLTENGFCPRCDWGGQAAGAEWAEVTPIPSVKRDIADGISLASQASVYDWSAEGL